MPALAPHPQRPAHLMRRPALPSRGLPQELRRELLKRPAYERPRGSGRVASEPRPGYFTLKLARRALLCPRLYGGRAR